MWRRAVRRGNRRFYRAIASLIWFVGCRTDRAGERVFPSFAEPSMPHEDGNLLFPFTTGSR